MEELLIEIAVIGADCCKSIMPAIAMAFVTRALGGS